MKTCRILALLLVSVLLLPALASCVNMDARPGNHRHNYGDWYVIQEPTYDSTGLRERRCSCGMSETEIIDALNDAEYPYEEIKDIELFTNSEYAPYTYYENGALRGIEIDFAEEIANRMGVSLSINDVDFDSIVHHVAEPSDSNVAFIGMSGITVTDSRQEIVDFTTPYLTHYMVLLSQPGRFGSVDAFNSESGHSIGAVAGTAEHIYAAHDADQIGNDFVAYDTYSQAIDALVNGEVDTLLLPLGILEFFRPSAYGLEALEGYYQQLSYAIAVPKGNRNLLSRLNQIIIDMQNDGSLDSILLKYYQDWAER